ncbi:MAG: hypothetical protein HY909_02240 [Deltaproteobacteria bacterium]|nr:hypothetical protein [Deltaproteobacteria bacterium]
MRRRALVCLLLVGSCGGPEAPALQLRMADPFLMLSDITGPLHLRVFPKGGLTCETATGHVLQGGRRYLQGPEVDPVTPAQRCGPGFNATSGNTASPVDQCIGRDGPSTVEIRQEGTFIVLVHGQGTLRFPDGMTTPGTVAAGCAEVPLVLGQTRSITIALHGQQPMGVCGNMRREFGETCDGEPGCEQCQTPEVRVNTNAAGSQRNPSAVWGRDQRLVVAWERATVPEDVFARYFTNEGLPETTPAALANEVLLASGPDYQNNVRLAPASAGFVAAWETAASLNVAAQAFGSGAPMGDQSVVFGGGDGRQGSPDIAASAQRVVALWRDDALRAVRGASAPLASRLTAPDAMSVFTLSSMNANNPRVVARPDGTFVAAWTQGGDVFSQRIDANGAPTGSPVMVHPASGDAQDQPALAALSDNTAVVAWHDTGRDMADGDDSVRWVRLDMNGAPQGAPHVVASTTAGVQRDPAVAAAGSPPVLFFAWADPGTGHIRGRLRTPEDREVLNSVNGLGADFQVSRSMGGAARSAPSVAAGGPTGETFAIAWEDDDGAERGISLRRIPR